MFNKLKIIFVLTSMPMLNWYCGDTNRTPTQTAATVVLNQKTIIDSMAHAIQMRSDTNTKGMVWIQGGAFMMGGDNDQASADEYPKHAVQLMGFWMDETEVTNAQFKEFVAATGFVTLAERVPTWEELQKNVAAEYAKAARFSVCGGFVGVSKD